MESQWACWEDPPAPALPARWSWGLRGVMRLEPSRKRRKGPRTARTPTVLVLAPSPGASGQVSLWPRTWLLCAPPRPEGLAAGRFPSSSPIQQGPGPAVTCAPATPSAEAGLQLPRGHRPGAVRPAADPQEEDWSPCPPLPDGCASPGTPWPASLSFWKSCPGCHFIGLNFPPVFSLHLRD